MKIYPITEVRLFYDKSSVALNHNYYNFLSRLLSNFFWRIMDISCKAQAFIHKRWMWLPIVDKGLNIYFRMEESDSDPTNIIENG